MDELIAEIKTKFIAIIENYKCEPNTRATRESLVQEVGILFDRYGLEDVQFSINEDKHNPEAITVEPCGLRDHIVFKGILS